MTGLMISSMTASLRVGCFIASACWVETTTVSTRDRAGALVLDGDLGLAVGPQEVELSVAARLGEALDEAVREREGQRHQLLGLAHGVAEHQSLVAGAAGVHALGDVRRLRVDRGDDRAGLVVESELRARVADLLDRVPDDRRKVDVSLGRDLAGDEGESRRDEGLAGHAARGIVAEHRVQDRVGDLVGDLVRVTLGHRLGGEVVSAVLEHRLSFEKCGGCPGNAQVSRPRPNGQRGDGKRGSRRDGEDRREPPRAALGGADSLLPALEKIERVSSVGAVADPCEAVDR